MSSYQPEYVDYTQEVVISSTETAPDVNIEQPTYYNIEYNESIIDTSPN